MIITFIHIVSNIKLYLVKIYFLTPEYLVVNEFLLPLNFLFYCNLSGNHAGLDFQASQCIPMVTLPLTLGVVRPLESFDVIRTFWQDESSS